MKLPYGYVLDSEKIAIYEERADAVKSIFEYYLAGSSLGKIVEMLFVKGIPSPTGNSKWTRAAVDKLLSNKKYVPIVVTWRLNLKRAVGVMWIMTELGIQERRSDIGLLKIK